MEKKESTLTNYQKIVLASFIVGGGTSLVLFVLAFCNILSIFIPIGVLLGVLIVACSYLVLIKIENLETEETKLKGSIIVVTMRLFLLVAFTVTELLLQTKANFTLFNLYGLFGGYLGTTFVSLIFIIKERKYAKRN